MPRSLVLEQAPQLLDSGFVEIPAPGSPLAKHIPLITNGIAAMVADPEAAVFFNRFALDRDEVGWKNDVGLEHRTDGERKWYFHHVLDRAPWNTTTPVYARYAAFITALETITRYNRDIAIRVASDTDEYLGSAASLADAIARSWAVTRVLYYEPEQDAARPDATLHIDRDTLTVHAYASHQGLVVIDSEGRRRRVDETNPDTTLVFPGKKFGGFYAGRYGLGTVHGVHDPRRTAGQAPREARIALVTFVHSTLTPDQAGWIISHKTAFTEEESRHIL